MPDTFTPGEVAEQLGVQDRTVRRMAKVYETVFDDLPRLRPEDDRSPRLWTSEAVRRVQVAQMALKSGKVISLQHALELVRDGGDLPERTELLTGQGPDTLAADLLVEVLVEVRAIRAENAELRALADAQGRELVVLRSVMAENRMLSAPAPAGDELAREVQALRALVTAQGEREAERFRLAAHVTSPQADSPHPTQGLLKGLLRLIGVRS